MVAKVSNPRCRRLVVVDPGANGCACFVDGDNKAIVIDFGDQGLVRKLRSILPTDGWEVYMENVHAMPGQGVTSMFSFGRNFGWWLGVFGLMGLDVHGLEPRTWIKEVYDYHHCNSEVPLPSYKEYTQIDKKDRKKSNLFLARSLFGIEGLEKIKYHDRADALLMTDHVIRTRGGDV